MFILQSVYDKDNVQYLYCGSEILVSRNGGHVRCPNDKSVSRAHANFSMTHNESDLDNCALRPQIFIEDLGSTYGTYLNEGIETSTKLKPYELQQLHDGDTIRFGLLKNIWKLTYKQIIACTSLVENLSDVKQALTFLGGHLLKNWTKDCNLLLMNDLILTAKAVCALSSCSNIVVPRYLIHLEKSVRNRWKHPVPLAFQPPLKEICIGKGHTCFSPDPKRKSLFNRKNFIFSSLKSLHKLQCAILLSGGTVELLSNDNLNFLSKTGNILINQPDDQNLPNELLNKANEILQVNSLIALPESDIGLAIVHISTENYCNPKFKVNDLLCRKKTSEIYPTQNLEIYATETQLDEVRPIRTYEISPAHQPIMKSDKSRRLASYPKTSNSPWPDHSKLYSHLNPSLPIAIPSLPSQMPSLPTQRASLQNELPSLPPFSLREGYMEDTCMSTQPQACSVQKMQKTTNKRERLSSDERQSPDNKKRNLSSPKEFQFTKGIDMQSNTHQQNENFVELTQPIPPPFCSSMGDEALFNLGADTQLFNGKHDMEDGDTKPLLLTNNRSSAESSKTEVFKCPLPPKRKQTASSPILESRVKRVKSSDQVDCCLPGSLQTADVDFNSFALPFTSSSRQRRVVQPINTENAVSHNPEEVENGRLEKLDVNTNSKHTSPLTKEETLPFIGTQIKTEETDCVEESTTAQGEKSLMVIEVVSLVKLSFNKLSTPESTTPSFFGRNFKRFRKVSNGSYTGIIVSLPRIIGGQDLAINIDENPQKEIFLSSQQQDEPPSQPPSVHTIQQIDTEFNLPISKSSRHRGR